MLKNQLLSLWGDCLYSICCFSLVVFNIPLYIFFVSLISVSLCSPWVYPVWDSLCFLNLSECFLFHIRECLVYNLFKYFLWPFISLFSSGTPIIQMFVGFIMYQRSLRNLLISFIFFFLLLLFFSMAVIFTTLSSTSFIHSSASVVLILFPSSVFFIS